jgi:hypothetical protein
MIFALILIFASVVSFMLGWAFGPVVSDLVAPRFKEGVFADRLAEIARGSDTPWLILTDDGEAKGHADEQSSPTP